MRSITRRASRCRRRCSTKSKQRKSSIKGSKQLNTNEIPKDAITFEADALHKAGVDFPPVPPRYRSFYFSHVFGGPGYSAGYYSYIWSEVLDADTVQWIKDHGGLKRDNGDRFRTMLLSRGG